MRKTEDLIQTINSMKEGGVFPSYIEYIRFPHYKNLEKDTLISFDFPISFFVGKNGHGKSSTLHSLYGCPSGYSLGDFWFSTEIDPIDESGERNCLIYGYLDENRALCEVLKHRAKRDGKLDYWEPSKPVKGYGMDTKIRHSPISKNVEYLDFRSELSAFDKFMYFAPFQKSARIQSKQDFVRRQSKHIKIALDNKDFIEHYGHVRNQIPEELKEQEVADISYILGKKYESITIIEHSLLKDWGFSVYLSSKTGGYSEAFAGSGETAIVRLVHKLSTAAEGSLILLDEPETSLHSGAQKRLLQYLLNLIVKKKFQVVISTHSPFFIDKMPSTALKVFSSSESGKFHVENEREPREAFYELEIEPGSDLIQVVVEDLTAKTVVDQVLSSQGDDVKSSFEVKYLSGGVETLKQRFATFLDFSNIPYLLLDGDQKILDSHINLDSIPPEEVSTSKNLLKLLTTQTGCEIKFYPNGGDGGGNEEDKKELIRRYFKFYESHVKYLPKLIPEDFIWSDDLAISKCELFDLDTDLTTIKVGDSKQWFHNLCLRLFESAEPYQTVILEFTKVWVIKKDESYQEIVETLKKIKSPA